MADSGGLEPDAEPDPMLAEFLEMIGAEARTVSFAALSVCTTMGHRFEGRVDLRHGACIGECEQCGVAILTDC